MAVIQVVEGDENALLQLTGVAAGSRLFAITAHWDVANHGVLPGLTDSSGDTWSEVGQSLDSGAGAVQLWTCASASAGTHTITASPGTEFYFAVLFETSAGSSLDVFVANASDDLPLVTGSTGTLTGPNSLLIAAANICDEGSDDNLGIQTPSGWTTLYNHQFGNLSGPGLASCYREVSGTGAQSCDWGSLARGGQFFSALIAAYTEEPPSGSGVVGKTRPFGAGPFGFASFGSWRIRRSDARAVGLSDARGNAVALWSSRGAVLPQSHAAGGALNPKGASGRAAALSLLLGGAVRDRIAYVIAFTSSDCFGRAVALRGGFGEVAAVSVAYGRLRELWDRPDDIPPAPGWQPVNPGASGPWNPITMPAPPVWVPQQPAEQ